MSNTCISCNSVRILSISGKTSDKFSACMGNKQYNDYVPYGLGIGGGDYMRFQYCLDCGTIQDNFPVTDETLDDIFGDNTDDESDGW